MNFTDIYYKAVKFGTAKHEGQEYGNGRPYTDHLRHVEVTVLKYLSHLGERCQPILLAAWLHDTVEDTNTTVEEVAAEFGPKVADLVYAVTNESGKNRAERHEKTYPKILARPDAMLLKLCDRIANTETSLASYEADLAASKGGSRKPILGMYVKEYEAFKAAMWSAMEEAQPLWAHLDALHAEARKLISGV